MICEDSNYERGMNDYTLMLPIVLSLKTVKKNLRTKIPKGKKFY